MNRQAARSGFLSQSLVWFALACGALAAAFTQRMVVPAIALAAAWIASRRFTRSGASAREELLRETERMHEEAQAVAKIGNWRFDLGTQKFTWSKEMYRLFSRDPLLGEPTFEEHCSVVHIADRAHWMTALQQCLMDGTPYVIRFRVGAGTDAGWRWIEALGQSTRDSMGGLASVFGTCQDITERVEAEEESRLVMQALGIGIWKYDFSTGRLEWDGRMHELYGTKRGEFTPSHETWLQSVAEECRARVLKEQEKVLRGESGMYDVGFEIQLPSGGRRTLGGRGFVLRGDEGQPRKVYGVNWGRTDEAQLEKSLQLERSKSLHSAKLASLGEMAASIAHEINNPLAVITAHAALMKLQPGDGSKSVERAEIIERSAARIARIVSGMRRFSRSTEVKQFRWADLSKIVSDAATVIAPKARIAGVDIVIGAEPGLRVYCDELDIEQVVVNLLANAIYACKTQREKWVRVRSFREDGRVRMRVLDSGYGIAVPLREKLFEPFFTNKPVGEGTGLGLSIVKGILDDHGASISLLDHLPNTCFEVQFPSDETEDAAA